MVRARWQATITDEEGNVLPAASIEVRREGVGSPLAILYSDRDGATVIGNPFNADTDGFAAFHVAGGAYRIMATLGAISRTWRYVAVGTGGEIDSDGLVYTDPDGNLPLTGYVELQDLPTDEPDAPATGAVRLYAQDEQLALKASDGIKKIFIASDENGDVSDIRNFSLSGFIDLTEMAPGSPLEPDAPGSNIGRVYAQDDGAGTTVIYMRGPNGDRAPMSHFQPVGSGAVTRPTQEKLRDNAPSVMDFGAIGDGVTDDTLAIQAAIDAADGGAVFFPWTSTGYRLTDGIEFGAGLTPSGRAKHLIGEAYVRLFFDNMANTVDAVTMHFDTLAGIQGLTIDMGNPDATNATYSDGRDGLRIRGGEWGHLDVNIINCGRDGVHFEAGAAFEWHENFNGKLRIFNCGRDAMHCRLPDFNAVFLNECRFQLFEARRWKRHAIHAVVNTAVATYSAAKMSNVGFENINLDANRNAADMTATDLIYFETDAGAPSGGLFDNWVFLQGGWENVMQAMTGRGINMDAGVTVSDLQMGPIVFFNVDPGAGEIDRMVNIARLTLPYWLRCGTSGGDVDRIGPHEFTMPVGAVNGLQVLGTATGTGVAFAARGSDTNIGMNFSTKGAENMQLMVNNFGTAGVQVLASPAGAVQFPNIATTASAANAFVNSASSNRLLRSTSSRRYKRDIEPVEDRFSEAVVNLQPVWYRSKAPSDNPRWSWYGLVAEDVAKIDPRLVHWGYRDEDYELVPTGAPKGQGPEFKHQLKQGSVKVPDGVMYDRLSVLLLSVIQRQEKRLQALEHKALDQSRG